MTRRLVLLASLFGGIAAAAAAPAPAPLQVGNWSGAPQFDSRTKQFERCSASQNNGSGTTITFSLDRTFAWGLGFSNPSWAFASGHSLGLILTLGKSEQVRQDAQVADAHRLELRLDDSMTLFARLRVMPQLRAAAGGLTFSFDMRDNHEIMSALAQCVLKHGGPPLNPRTKTPPRPSDPLKVLDRSDAVRAEASAIAQDVIGYAEIRGAQVLTNNQTPDGMQAHAIWKAGHITGMVSALQPGQVASAESLAVDLIRHAATNCQGRLFVAAMPDRIERMTVRRAFTSCQSEAATASIFQTIAPRSSGGFYLLTVMIDRVEYIGAIQGSAEEVDAKVRAVLPSVLGRAAQRAAAGSAADAPEDEQQPR